MNDIQFKQDTELEVVTDFDAATDMIRAAHNEIFRKEEITPAVEIIDSDTPDYCDLQFGDGSVCHGVLRSSFDIVG